MEFPEQFCREHQAILQAVVRRIGEVVTESSATISLSQPGEQADIVTVRRGISPDSPDAPYDERDEAGQVARAVWDDDRAQLGEVMRYWVRHALLGRVSRIQADTSLLIDQSEGKPMNMREWRRLAERELPYDTAAYAITPHRLRDGRDAELIVVTAEGPVPNPRRAPKYHGVLHAARVQDGQVEQAFLLTSYNNAVRSALTRMNTPLDAAQLRFIDIFGTSYELIKLLVGALADEQEIDRLIGDLPAPDPRVYSKEEVTSLLAELRERAVNASEGWKIGYELGLYTPSAEQLSELKELL